jgi:YegS/Rv2252/BmrU family lipid kinase
MMKALFIINPRSGTDRVKELQYLIEKNLNHKEFSFEIAYTQYAQHGTLLAKTAAAQGVGLIVAVGGDGSVNDVINGIYGTDAILAILPKGSGNGLARSLGIPLNTAKAIQLINTLHPIEMDLGIADRHLFSSTAGVGFDALIAEQFAAGKRRGFIAYSWLIIKHLWRYKLMEWDIEIDGKHFREKAFMLTVANAVQLGYGFKIAPVASLRDGIFDIIILKKFPKLLAFVIALRAFRGTLLKSRYVTFLKGKEIKIRQPQLRSLQYDGEAVTCDGPEVAIKMLPKAVKVLAAKGF